MSSIAAPVPTRPLSASSSIVPPHHPSRVSPPPVPTNTFIISFAALAPPPPPPPSHPSLSTPPRSSWIDFPPLQARSNLFREAISTYVVMIALASIPPDQFAFPAVLKAAAGLQDLNVRKQIHGNAVKLGYEQFSVTVANTLPTMYDKCGKIRNVFKLFDRIPERNQVSWNSMFAALCRDEEWADRFRSMESENLEPSSFTLIHLESMLKVAYQNYGQICEYCGKLDFDSTTSSNSMTFTSVDNTRGYHDYSFGTINQQKFVSLETGNIGNCLRAPVSDSMSFMSMQANSALITSQYPVQGDMLSSWDEEFLEIADIQPQMDS